MLPKINSKEIKEKATKPARRKVSLFLDQNVYDEFVENCKPATISVVLEELMKAFNEDIKVSQPKRSSHRK